MLGSKLSSAAAELHPVVRPELKRAAVRFHPDFEHCSRKCIDVDETRVSTRFGGLELVAINLRTAFHAEEFRERAKAKGCDITGLQETCQPGKTELTAAE